MGVAKIQNLRACPAVCANLSFEVGGIIEASNVSLGQSVTAFILSTLYGNLGVATNPTLPANLMNSGDILTSVGGNSLMSLRAEGIKAALDKACALRANVYYQRFANQSNIISQMQTNYAAAISPYAYSAMNPASKPTYLSSLATLATQQYTSLQTAYNGDSTRNLSGTGPNPGVVQSTTSNLQSWTVAGNTVSASYAGGYQTGSVSSGPGAPGSNQDISLYLQNKVNNVTNPIVTPTQITNDPNASPQYQTMSYTDYGFRVPSIEANAQVLRAQISLMDEQFSAYMTTQCLPNISAIFANSLMSIDMDVKRLQVGYLNTILLPSITGVVTGVNKQPGDAVRAGETVIRLESYAQVFLVGALIYRAPLPLGTIATVQTNRWSSSAQGAISVNGTIVAARGNEFGDDHWEVVISCNNQPGGPGTNPIFPPYYSFDFDDTTVTIGSIAVPNVVGPPQMSLTAAAAAITGAGLTPVVAAPGAVVMEQAPSPGTLVPNGYPVNLVGGVPVPNVVGQTLAAAEAAISSAGLTPVVAGLVVVVAQQAPAATVVVPFGTPVVLA